MSIPRDTHRGRAHSPLENLGIVADRVSRAVLDPAPFDPSRLDRLDPELVAALLPLFEAFNRHWLRLAVSGLENVVQSPALYVANHNGGIMGPDLTCTLATLWRALGPARPLHALAHDFAMRTLPPFGRAVQAAGGLRAHPDNAIRALEHGASVLVYPGGDLDAYRHFRHRARVRFGTRTGFVRVAQRTGVPIVPVVAEGAHRSAVIFHEGETLARVLGLHRSIRTTRFPLALSFPWIIGAGPWVPYLPLPFRIQLRILPPVYVADHEDPAKVRDHVVARMQSAMDAMSAR